MMMKMLENSTLLSGGAVRPAPARWMPPLMYQVCTGNGRS